MRKYDGPDSEHTVPKVMIVSQSLVSPSLSSSPDNKDWEDKYHNLHKLIIETKKYKCKAKQAGTHKGSVNFLFLMTSVI